MSPQSMSPIDPDKTSESMAWWRASMAARDRRLEWWRQARFGMFLHWGVYSGLGGMWQGRPVPGYAEHIQRRFRIPIPTYRAEVAARFNPTAFDADAWAALAKRAGMGYMVITAKHHDGFAMYPSAASDYNIVRATPFGRDPMRELKEACDRHGLRFGFYYSQAFDWGDAEGPGNDWDYENPGGDRGLHGGRDWWAATPELLPQVRRYVERKAIPQLRELIRTYDPDILWGDTPQKLPAEENLRILRAVRAAKPDIVVNSRICQGTTWGRYGDYVSTTDKPDEFPPTDRLGEWRDAWEAIPTTNESYGYHQADRSHKPAAYFIRLLAKAAARGGNLLLNIGPMGDGRFDPADAAILEGIGDWMTANRESIAGTEASPLPAQAWGHCTRRGVRVYLHVFDWPRGGAIEVGGLGGELRGAMALAGGAGPERPLALRRTGPWDLAVAGPAQPPDATDSVLVLEAADADLRTDPVRALSRTQANRLHVFDGELRGAGGPDGAPSPAAALRFGAGKAANAYVDAWTDAGDLVAWKVRLPASGAFEVAVGYDAPAESAGGRFEVAVGTAAVLDGAVEAGTERVAALGSVRLEAGRCEIAVRARHIEGSELMRLRTVTLRPA